MAFDNIIDYFLPGGIKGNKTHPRYDELRTVLTTTLVGLPLVLLFPIVVYWLGYPYIGFLINALLVVTIILSIKFFGHYRLPMSTTALVTYVIIYDWTAGSGMIYSPNVAILHMYLLAAILSDKRYGWLALFSNLFLFGLIYYRSLEGGIAPQVHLQLGGAEYALIMNCLITIFFGGFLAYFQIDQERDRKKIRRLQEERICVLDKAVRERTEQLNTIRESMASDFHDQTGNLLAAITRQASMLKLKMNLSGQELVMVDGIISASNELYGSSRDFLWHLNHNSDDPLVLFEHLTSFGQNFCNQFDIAFSSYREDCDGLQLYPSASLNLLFIVKEAMTNCVKHSGATEIYLELRCSAEVLEFIVRDNGKWKEQDPSFAHFGLEGMRKRAKKNSFVLHIAKAAAGTSVCVQVPVINYTSIS